MCSWQARPTRVYFSSEILCRGEIFKAVAHVPEELRDVRLHILRQDAEDTLEGEELLPVEDKLLLFDRFPWPNARGIFLDTSELLGVGSYVARVYADAPGRRSETGEERPSDRREREESTDDESADEGLIGEHWFQVLDPEDYEEHWRGLFGETWDEPVYCDSLETGQAAELLEGLPLDDLFEALPEDLELNGETMCRLAGPIATALITAEGQGLPCPVEHRFEQLSKELPHINLTELLWLLNALAPALLDMALSSPRLSVRTEVSDHDLFMNIRPRSTNEAEEFYASRGKDRDFAPIVSIVESIAKTARIKWDGRGLGLLLKSDRY
jgi:hypothetical protein